MGIPLTFTIGEVTCHTTFDLLGDDLIGVLGTVTFPIGTFRKLPGDASVIRQTDPITQAVPPGQIFLVIKKHNLLSADDTLLVIDLTQNPGVTKSYTIASGNGFYELALTSVVTPDVLTPVGG